MTGKRLYPGSGLVQLFLQSKAYASNALLETNCYALNFYDSFNNSLILFIVSELLGRK